MKRLELVPDGWPLTFKECPPGLFLFNNSCAFKTEYHSNSGHIIAYNQSGESFWGGTKTVEERDALVVQPLITKWTKEDEVDE